MNERLFRTQFNQMETTEKQALMESLATRYDMAFLGLHTFDRWGQSCTTGVFEKDGREFVFVPGDTVTLTVNSGGQEKEVQVTLGDDSASQKAKQEQQSQEQSMNGYSLEDLFGRQR